MPAGSDNILSWLHECANLPDLFIEENDADNSHNDNEPDSFVTMVKNILTNNPNMIYMVSRQNISDAQIALLRQDNIEITEYCDDFQLSCNIP